MTRELDSTSPMQRSVPVLGAVGTLSVSLLTSAFSVAPVLNNAPAAWRWLSIAVFLSATFWLASRFCFPFFRTRGLGKIELQNRSSDEQPVDQLSPGEPTLIQRRIPVALPSSESLFEQIDEDIRLGCDETLLGLIELKDYDRLYAFEQAAAQSALTCFARNLSKVIPSRYSSAHVDRGIFAVWFRGAPPATVRAELATIRYALSDEIWASGISVIPEIELKVGIFPEHGRSAKSLVTRTLISNAEFGDSSGDPSLSKSNTAQRERYSLEQSLRHAVERQELELHYQPIVDLADGSIAGAEALIRWNHPTEGRIPPARFVPILEEIGLIDEIGMWSLNAACGTCRKWQGQGLSDLSVAVNLSAKQLLKPNLALAVERVLNRHELEPQSLTLELTETAAMHDSERTLALFRELKAIGVNLAIDDFGTGYSSLSYLLKLPFDKLKIDREFVVDVNRHAERRAICSSLCELAKGLDIDLIAEGAETSEEVAELKRLGCRFVQGFYFSPPLSEPEFVDLASAPPWQSNAPKRAVSGRSGRAEIAA